MKPFGQKMKAVVLLYVIVPPSLKTFFVSFYYALGITSPKISCSIRSKIYQKSAKMEV